MEKGSRGGRGSPRQSGRVCQRVASGHFSASAAPPNEPATTTFYQSDGLFLRPHKLSGARVKVTDRLITLPV